MEGDNVRWARLRRGYRGLKDDMEAPVSDDGSEISRKKRRFAVIVVFGIVMSFVAFLISISISSGGVISVSEAVSALFSAIGKVRHSSFRMMAMDRDNQVNVNKTYVNISDAPTVLQRHGGNRNAVYLDGHVGTLRFAEIPRNREHSFWGYNAAGKGFTY